MAAFGDLSSSYAAGAWAFGVCPPYPLGYVQIAEHRPWRAESLTVIAASAFALLLVREFWGLVAPPLGRRFAAAMHGTAWLSSAHARDVDWRRFAEVVHCTVLHAVTTVYVCCSLGDELHAWVSDPSLWWTFSQPALSGALHDFYLVELGITFEAVLAMMLTRRAKDRPMSVHHLATLFLFLAAYRLGFVRVGAAVVALHDASDLPIDGIRIAQALEAPTLLYTSAVCAVTSWGYLRVYCFPRYIIGSILTQTGELADLCVGAGTLDFPQ